MDKKQSIEELNNILTNFPVTTEQKAAIEYAINKLETGNTKETLIEVVKILAALLSAGSKFFDP